MAQPLLSHLQDEGEEEVRLRDLCLARSSYDDLFERGRILNWVTDDLTGLHAEVEFLDVGHTQYEPLYRLRK